MLPTFGSNSVVGLSLLKSEKDALVEDLGQNVICSKAPWFSYSISRSIEKTVLCMKRLGIRIQIPTDLTIQSRQVLSGV